MTARRRRPLARRVREPAAQYGIATGAIVVDASIAYLWFVNEPDSPDARRLLGSDSTLLAPDFMAAEATNAWWKKCRRREMDVTDVDQAVTNLLAAGIAWIPTAVLLRSAARTASELDHPVYDSLYLSLATSQPASLATADTRLKKAAERLGIPIWR